MILYQTWQEYEMLLWHRSMHAATHCIVMGAYVRVRRGVHAYMCRSQVSVPLEFLHNTGTLPPRNCGCLRALEGHAILTMYFSIAVHYRFPTIITALRKREVSLMSSEAILVLLLHSVNQKEPISRILSVCSTTPWQVWGEGGEEEEGGESIIPDKLS